MSLQLPARILGVALAASVSGGLVAAGPPPIVRETVWNLRVDVIALGPATAGSLGEYAMSASRREPGTLEIRPGKNKGWPDGELQLTATIERLLEDEALVDFATGLVRPGRPTVRASRRFSLREGGSHVIEVFGEGDRRLLLSIRGEEGSRPVLRRLASTGAPVAFRVEIEHVEGERTVPLESNDLNTFVGESVEYSFDFGGDSQRLRLVLTPVSISGSLGQIRAQISGQLSSDSGPVILSRDQVIAASRGATSSVEVVAGDPPRGYRFRITPEF